MERSIIRLDRVDSTNNYIRQFSQHGLVVVADSQTDGRGRQGRSFQSVPGKGLYFSVLLKPQVSVAQVFSLTPVAAQAVCDGIQTLTGHRPGIKWINDLILEGRKICGILTELTLTSEGEVDSLILGVGVNVNQTLEEFDDQLRDKAGSLVMATGQSWDREALLEAVLNALDTRLEGWLQGDADLEGYRADCLTLGREVRVLRGGESRPAFAETVDDEFALVVRYPDGRREKLSSGEVFIRGREGYL